PERAVAAAADRDHGLDRALAERGPAQDDAALAVLDGAGDDLRRGGRALVDQDDDLLAFQQVAGAGGVDGDLAGVAAAGRDDRAAVEEGVGHGHGLIEQAARVVAQVDDDAGQAVAELGLEVADRVFQHVGRLLVEGGDADHADIIAFDAPG